MKKKSFLIVLLLAISLLSLSLVSAADLASPPGCNADDSNVNIARSKASAQAGDVVTFSVTAANVNGEGGCDVDNRYITLILPNGTHYVFGPFDYPFDTNTTFVGSVDYVTNTADVVGNSWTASVIWNGTLRDGFDNPSVGGKQISVNYAPVSLDVSKTADAMYTQEWDWFINKTAMPTELHLFAGDSDDVTYNVSVTNELVEDILLVNGTITIMNPALFADATIVSVVDTLPNNITPVEVICEEELPHTLAPGATLICSYSAHLADTSLVNNTVVVETEGDVGGGTALALVEFGSPSSGTSSITVNDTNIDEAEDYPWAFTDDGFVLYDLTFSCSPDFEDYTDGYYNYTVDNTATIVENGKTADASVVVHCYNLVVEKTAEVDYEILYEWTINKTGNETMLVLDVDEVYSVEYLIELGVDYDMSDYVLTGTITISNYFNEPITLTNITDELADVIDCGGSWVVPAEGSLVCTYEGTFEEFAEQENEVVVEFGELIYSANADIVYNDPTITDACIYVSDTNSEGPQNEFVCFDDEELFFEYIVDLSYDVCLEEGMDYYEHVNNASFITEDTETTGWSSWTVLVDVPCEFEGCTLTRGYWQTHSSYGPAPYDDTWEAFGENTIFFLSEKSWYDVMWTPPSGGNAYYQLAPQYIAAMLSIEKGAHAPQDVLDALDDAEDLFSTYTPTQVGAWRGNQGERGEFSRLASLLDDYNNGLLGVPHCDALETY